MGAGPSWISPCFGLSPRPVTTDLVTNTTDASSRRVDEAALTLHLDNQCLLCTGGIITTSEIAEYVPRTPPPKDGALLISSVCFQMSVEGRTNSCLTRSN